LLSEDDRASFGDVIAAIAAIQEYTAGKTFEEYRARRQFRSSVEREILIISEAAIRLGETAPRLCPLIPWHDIRGIGNQIRHAYDEVDADLIWVTATRDVVPLKAAVEAALASG
jgi:uncharacterized protein with HEPN domain